MKISVFGMGYVGLVSAACLSGEGHEVIGVDLNPDKIDPVNRGSSPIMEEGLSELIQTSVNSGHLRATSDAKEALFNTEISLICVGTPSKPNGALNLDYVEQVCREIGGILKDKPQHHTVIIRSTMLPGSTRKRVLPALEETSGKKVGQDFSLCFNPEFLREGTAIYDFKNPPKTVIGAYEPSHGKALIEIYKGLNAPLIETDLETSELVKYADNTWHALKIGFANEIGNVCKVLDIDSHGVMDIFCQDRKLNISSYYLKPGFAFGGSCLPKDLRAINQLCQEQNINAPILGSVLTSNREQIERGVQMVLDLGLRKIGILGFSFKEGTDDLRESPMVELIERLLGKGLDIRLYDRNVDMARLMGANRDFIVNRISHISSLMVGSVEEVLDHSEVVVVGTNDPEFKDVDKKLSSEQVLVDLVRIIKDRRTGKGYHGICW